jgi:serine phosphatase RsbU (regulator of sigma subunit)
LPLMVEEECIGVLTVQSFKKNAYSQEKLNILKTLSTFTSIAIDNYHNYTDLEKAKKEIEQNKQKTEDSIRYAETIQKAILPDSNFLQNALGQHFVIFQPQAIVSGDFYWCRKVKEKIFFAVLDCTGHGVPGAFMSIIGSTVLNDIVVQQKIHAPAQALEELHFGVRSALRQDNRTNDDGMDVCLIVLEKLDENGNVIPSESENYAQMRLTYAGAKRPLYYVMEGELATLEATKRSIGGGRNVVQKPFAQQTLLLPKGTMIYLATDGYADQNNPEKEKIGSNTLKSWLQEIAHEDVALQEIKLLTRLIDHMRDENAQRDDITLVGVRV